MLFTWSTRFSALFCRADSRVASSLSITCGKSPGGWTVGIYRDVAAIGNGAAFSCGRDLAAWLGLVPKQYSTGDKPLLLGISKRGNNYLRTLFVHGARAVLFRVKYDTGGLGAWV